MPTECFKIPKSVSKSPKLCIMATGFIITNNPCLLCMSHIYLPSKKKKSHSCTESLILTLARPDPEHFIRGCHDFWGGGGHVGREFCERSEPLARWCEAPPSELRRGSGGAAPGKFSEFLGTRRPGEAIWYLCSLIQIQLLNHKNYESG